MDHPLTIVVAATRKNGIGISTCGLPWRLPAEMAYFVRVTSNAPPGKMNAVVMGRKSWESIPPKFRPLKDRLNIVISSRKGYDLGKNTGSVILASSLSEGLASIQALKTFPSNDTTQSDTVPASTTEVQPLPHSPFLIHRTFIIGGATIYTQALQTLPNLNRILLTRVLEPSFDECDVFLPEFRPVESVDDGEKEEGKEVSSVAVGRVVSPSWEQADHDGLVRWVGFDVAKGINEENGVKYEFQMWVRAGDPYPDA